MCLRKSNFKIAKEDITCYKVYLEFRNKTLLSPFRRELAPKLGILTSTELGEVDIHGMVKLGFHSFFEFDDAVEECRDWDYNYRFIPLIAECTVPRNSMYYEGYFDKKKSYCSKYIKLNKLIYIN